MTAAGAWPSVRRGLTPEQQLAAAVVRQALRDAQASRGATGRAARQWLADGHYTFWCEVLGLPASRLQRYLDTAVGLSVAADRPPSPMPEDP